uniref:Uncharacterized protein n=1 Tax=Tetraselmis sp. GSL018 TaxID=582737 RepID=A0A061S2J8_9CHLO
MILGPQQSPYEGEAGCSYLNQNFHFSSLPF